MKAIWRMLRMVRLTLWLGVVAYFIHFWLYRDAHLTGFGHLLTTTELWMFGLPSAAIFVGFLELMARERAGLPRPAFGRNWS
jgi:hypothetical protein